MDLKKSGKAYRDVPGKTDKEILEYRYQILCTNSIAAIAFIVLQLTVY